MTTGALLPMSSKTLKLVLDAMKDHLDRNDDRMTDSQAARIIIRNGLAAGAGEEISVAPAGAEQPQVAAQPTVRAGARTGRNDACPCGSGKKYKKCCGA